MTIQWFPGHMTKAKREMEARLKQVDCIIELRDARAVRASHNPLIDEIRGQKPLLIVLTKKDLADSLITTQWLEYFQKEAISAIALNLNKDNVISVIDNKINHVMKEKHDKQRARGINPRATRAMVTGIPNVGKSTFINRLKQRNVLKTGNQPGVTRSLTFIKVSEQLELVDTPGLLWPKFTAAETGIHLGLTNAIAQRVLPFDELLQYGYSHLSAYPEFTQYYGFSGHNYDEFLRKLAAEKYLSNDLEMVKQAFLKDIQDGRIMRYSWESPDD